MKGCRDGKSAKMSATRNCLYSAVVSFLAFTTTAPYRFLLHSFLLIYHPYTPSFHDTCSINFSLRCGETRAPAGRTKNANLCVHYARVMQVSLHNYSTDVMLHTVSVKHLGQ